MKALRDYQARQNVDVSAEDAEFARLQQTRQANSADKIGESIYNADRARLANGNSMDVLKDHGVQSAELDLNGAIELVAED